MIVLDVGDAHRFVHNGLAFVVVLRVEVRGGEAALDGARCGGHVVGERVAVSLSGTPSNASRMAASLLSRLVVSEQLSVS